MILFFLFLMDMNNRCGCSGEIRDWIFIPDWICGAQMEKITHLILFFHSFISIHLYSLDFCI